MDFIHPLANGDAQNRYRDRQTDPATVAGSVVPAMFFNTIQDELIALITGAGLDPDAADLTQILQAVQALIAASAASGATTSASGLVELATAEETDAGADAVRAVTPAGLGINIRSKAPSGYQRLPGGVILQWLGIAPPGGDATFTWPLTFPNACFGAVAAITQGTSLVQVAKAFNESAVSVRVLTAESGLGTTELNAFVIGIGH